MERYISVLPWIVFLVIFLVASFITYSYQIHPLSTANEIKIIGQGIFLVNPQGETVNIGSAIEIAYMSGFWATLYGICAALIVEIVRTKFKK